ncbi:hypothetical protein NIE88_04970 [Sporolactobacillus shoreicorticis]|uniref:Uncharacterized protein n=1 Tax=Sporolactobacillus shoreicorticis TaxID=1923877 RepID=A0ABW5S1W7_9BACL|nr:hypothetical protein [Sporolactobacillus shoreicorticis]MCO7125126.1 hypothetical protein [Sporolactobacillus shoreicorticis]
MLDKIEAIKRALECECYLPALALALTLPDICGKVEYPKYNVGNRYENWFDNWVEHLYADPSGWDNDKRAKNPYFTGRLCYGLRCAFLHSGDSNIKEKFWGDQENDEYRYSYHFELCINGSDSFGETWETPHKEIKRIEKQKTVQINIVTLCKNICSAAEKYYKYKGKEAFADHIINLRDIQAEVDGFERFKN